MKTPRRLEPLIEDGLIDEVVRPLMSGKEASVYVVRCGDSLRCAKVYKEANKRSFRQAAEYQEGRKVRNSRQARAMAKARSMAAANRRKPGRMPKWRPCSVSPGPVCGCRSPMISSMACC